VKDAWARPSSTAVGVAGAFMTIENSGREADRLIAARSDVAETVELHETVIEGEVMKMRPVSEIVAPAGGEVTLKPGSFHIMLLGLTRDVQVGERIRLTLEFAGSGEVEVEAEVRLP
jgi:periplasmic copper chaperone A